LPHTVKTNKQMSLILKDIDMNVDIRTPFEKARDEKHRKICDDFLSLSNQIPDCKPNRIFNLLSQRYSMTVPGIKDVVIRNGLYETNRR